MAAADAWEQQRVLQYIQRHGFTRITLQFPDDLLPHAASVAQELQQLLLASGSGAKVYVLADTSYNPLSIDEAAAAHVKADCVVHYGHASLHPVSRTPALCVLPRRQLDVQHTSSWLVQQLAHLHKQVQQAGWSSSQDSKQQQQPVCVVCTDQCYLHQLPDLQQAVLQAYSGSMQLLFAHSASTELWPAGHPVAAAAAAADDTAAGDAGGAAATTTGPASQQQQQQQQQQAAVPTGGLMWQLPDSSSSSPDCMLWLGPPSSPALTHLQLSHASCPWLLLDPDGQGTTEGLSPGLDRLLKRRYYLVERARGATMVGLLVGTLGAAGYKTALEQLRRLAGEAGKKTYTLLMGKPNPAKLANFPEIEVFVMLADPQGLILDSKEYLNPIITPHEAFLAFTGREFDAAHYRLDFGDLLELQQQQAGVSGGAEGAAGGGGAAAAANVGGNITDIDGSGDGEEDAGDSVQQLSAAAGALVIAGSGGHSTALSSNKAGQQVQVHSAAQYLTQRRTYKGLETPATGAEILPASVAVAGRTGRAAAYVDEPQQ